jgi:hypothetical protein
MKTRALATLSILALIAAFAQPALPASGPAASYILNTREWDASSAGEYDGRLRLSISTDGIVSGNFMTTEGQVAGVSGGLSGTKIWLQVGNGVRGQIFTGTFADGKLETTRSGNGLHVWNFEGKPALR